MTLPATALETIQNAGTIIVKIGSVLVADQETGELKYDWIESFVSDISDLAKNHKVIIVSSGGIAAGRKFLDIPINTPPSSIPLELKQAASAVGQPHLFSAYRDAFAKAGITVAQVLLTMSETENRRAHLNARETLYTLVGKNIIPIINENDTVSTAEIRFGDNDRLAVRVGQMVMADAVILFSTTDGLYTDNPHTNPQAQHFAVVEDITEEHIGMAGEALSGLSVGGMRAKIDAAMAASQAGIPLIIAKGTQNNPIKSLLEDNEAKSTLFLAKNDTKSARKTWIGSHLNPKGSIFIDEGALKALKDGKSLLPIGVKRVEGVFQRGDAVEIKTLQGYEVGMGLSAYSAADAGKIAGKQSGDIETLLGYAGRIELIHRNDMALKV